MFVDSLPAVVQRLSAVCKDGVLQVPVTAHRLCEGLATISLGDEVVLGESTTVVICFNLQNILQIKTRVCITSGMWQVCFLQTLLVFEVGCSVSISQAVSLPPGLLSSLHTSFRESKSRKEAGALNPAVGCPR